MTKIGPRNPFDRRLNVRTRIRAQFDGATVWLDTLDLGLGGALCTAAEKLPMGRPVRCRIQVAGGSSPLWVEVQAEVLRCEYRVDSYRVAMKFSRQNKPIRDAMKRFLDHAEAKGATPA